MNVLQSPQIAHTLSLHSLKLKQKTERKKSSAMLIEVHTSYFYRHPYSTQARVKVEFPLLSLHLEEQTTKDRASTL